MKLYPETLFGRLITALLLVVVITGVLVAWLVMRERQEVVFWGGESADLVEFLATTSEELAALPPQERIERLVELRRTPLTVNWDEVRRLVRARQHEVEAAARSYQKQLQRQLGDDYRVQVRPADPAQGSVIRIGGRQYGGRDPRRFGEARRTPGEPERRPRDNASLNQLDVLIRLPDGSELTYRVPAPRGGAPLPRGIFVQLALLTLVLGTVLFLMARSITRPLSALANSAEAMSRGENPPPLPETGAKELKEATHAFNTMHERLERYMASRNSLLASISHDLRTPLTRLRLRAEKVEDPALRERFQHDVDEMNDMLKAALDLFRGMNDDEASVPVDIMALLGNLCVEFAEIGQTVTLVGSANGLIEARPNALKRCITNLVSNAVKYGDRATIYVSDGDELTIRVADEGPGIPEGLLEKVFEPFYRLEASRNPETGGTGLGLSIARDIAQAHGGGLRLENRRPDGLVAVLALPRV